MLDHVQAALNSAQEALQQLVLNQAALQHIAAAGKLLVSSFQSSGRVYSCGNGGSMCDAMHFAEELAGKFRGERPALPALAISDPGYLSCVGNDYGYEAVFARFIAAQARPGDVLVAISTSGSSANVVAAAAEARRLGVHVIALTGRPQSKLAALATIEICTPGGSPYADRVQELHIKVIHILIELCEFGLFGISGGSQVVVQSPSPERGKSAALPGRK